MADTRCQRCGACCRNLILEASEADAAREPRIAAEAIRLRTMAGEPDVFCLNRGNRPFSCMFLGGDNECTIYATRPRMCRQYPTGRPCERQRGNEHAAMMAAVEGLGEIEDRP